MLSTAAELRALAASPAIPLSARPPAYVTLHALARSTQGERHVRHVQAVASSPSNPTPIFARGLLQISQVSAGGMRVIDFMSCHLNRKWFKF